MDNSALTIPTRPQFVHEMLSDSSKQWRQTVPPKSFQRHMAWHGVASWCRGGWNVRLPEIWWDEANPCEETQFFLWSMHCWMTLPSTPYPTYPDLSITKICRIKTQVPTMMAIEVLTPKSWCQNSIEVIKLWSRLSRPSLKTASSHLKTDGWKMKFPFGKTYFQGLCLALGRVYIYICHIHVVTIDWIHAISLV